MMVFVKNVQGTLLVVAIFVACISAKTAKVVNKNTRANLKTANNETKKALNSTSRAERNYLNPLLTLTTPSDCDLTPNYCDLNCCSDKDCSVIQREAFECEQKETADSKHNFWSCREKTNLSSWHPFICYITDNSPFLGRHFLAPPEQINENNKFLKLADATQQFANDHPAKAKVDPPVYKFGFKMKILPNNNSEDHFFLPTKVPGSNFCLLDKPVRFLINENTVCLRELSADSCANYPISVDKFLERVIGNTGQALETANITNNFMCLNKRGENFVRIQKRDNRVIDYYSKDGIKEKFEPCTDILFTNSFFDPRTGICYNALISAEYRITWNGTNITSVNATFKLADVSIKMYEKTDSKTPKFFLSQTFSFAFEHWKANLHEMNESQNSTNEVEEPKSNNLPKIERSGNPGYLDGKPLIIGTLLNSTTDGGNETLEWEDGYLNLLFSNLDGDCVDLLPASFGFDILTSCKLKLQLPEISNCTLLSETLADFFDSLYYGEHAAKKGDRNFESLTDVVPILWSAVNNNSSEKDACLVMTGVSIKALFSEHFMAAGVKLSRMVGLRIDPLLQNLSLPAPSELLVSTSLHFLRVDSITETSKFWLQMTEHSENSWLEIFDPLIQIFKNQDNMEELIIFWTFFVATAFLLIGNSKLGRFN
ncbi:tectonic-1-like [Neocloeon triangulifer]|uniref:tectonic-1-like n=1 Tax=Neocloeon triangulifer TaxID=2078957 RepID=UPI00286EB813|nr:tectonic-1-like [Neocloeon triangulifer]